MHTHQRIEDSYTDTSPGSLRNAPLVTTIGDGIDTAIVVLIVILVIGAAVFVISINAWRLGNEQSP